MGGPGSVYFTKIEDLRLFTNLSAPVVSGDVVLVWDPAMKGLVTKCIQQLRAGHTNGFQLVCMM